MKTVIAAVSLCLVSALNVAAQCQFSTGAANITSNCGNVGILNASPGYTVETGTAFAGETSNIVTNTDAGTGSFASIGARNGTNLPDVFRMLAMGSGWSTVGAFVQDAGVLQAGANLSGGISILTSNASGVIRFYTGGQTERVRIDSTGNLGVGVSAPVAKLDVNGNVNVTGNITMSGNINAKFQDLAEWVPASQELAPGTVVVLNPEKNNDVIRSSRAYDTAVAGVVSAHPGVLLGVGSASKAMVATTGRVPVRVDASKGAIHVGDLLVTSDEPGMAMKSEAVDLGGVKIHRPGTIIGKALEPLQAGQGEILVLLTLQ